MADERVSSRYIKSLLGLAIEKNVLDQVHEDMLLFHKVCSENRDFVVMLRSPLIRHDLKNAILRKVFKGKVNAMTFSIFDILTRKNRESILPQIASDFHAAYNEYKGVGKAFITTTVPMDKTMREAIELIVKNLSGKKQVEIEEKVDKELIGGFVLHVGDKQVDASVRGKLRNLKTKFAEEIHLKN